MLETRAPAFMTSVLNPHPWLGLDYRDLLPGLASGQHRFTLSLTRPNGYCQGSGVLRVVNVLPSISGEPDGPAHCVLAYEGYTHNRPRHERKGEHGGSDNG